MDDLKLNIEVKVTVKPVSPKLGATQRGPYERNLFVVRESKTINYAGAKTDIAAFAVAAANVAGKASLEGLVMPKVVSVDPPGTIADTTAVLNATGDNQGVSCAHSVDYGVTPELGSNQAGAAPQPDVSADGTDTAYVFNLTGLTAETKYYYRVKLITSTGTVYSELQSFTTTA